MTEEEAKRRWCPFASNRTLSLKKDAGRVTTVSFLSAGSDDPSTLCIASACMAWRTVTAKTFEFSDEFGDAPRLISEARAGHCGLAGAPE